MRTIVELALLGMVVVLAAGSAMAGSIQAAGAAAKAAEADGAKMAAEVMAQLGGKPGAWVLFGRGAADADNQQKVMDAVRAVDPDIPLAGCWTEAGMFVFRDNKLTMGEFMLIGLAGEGVQFKAAMTKFTGYDDLAQAGRQLGEALKPASGKGLMVFMTDAVISHDGGYSMPRMYAALQEALGPQVALVGGNAGYGDKPVYCNGQIATKALVGLMISGEVAVKVVQESGKKALTPPLKITKLAKPNEIVELDGRPWQDVFKETMAEHIPADRVDAAIARGDGAWGQISNRFPHAILRERGQLYARLAHGLSPWGKGTYLPSEAYDLKVGDELVFTTAADDQVGEFRKGLQRLKADMPAGPRMFLLFPCETNNFIFSANARRGGLREMFVPMVFAELPAGATAWGFMPCGEHASLYEPGLDEKVCEARYYQLSYPMATVVVPEKAEP